MLQRSAGRVARGAMSDAAATSFVVGLGANLGDRRATLISAVRELKTRGKLLAVSALYESGAVGPAQPDYLNAAVQLLSPVPAQELLGELMTIERAHGRERRERWGPRTLDLDLLYSPGLVLSELSLTLPHPELTRRPFALYPLLDVAPLSVDPLSGARYADLLATLPSSDLRRLETNTQWCPGWAE